MLFAALLLTSAALPQIRQAETSEHEGPAPVDELDEVVIVGEPRMALWKVTWRNHTLWILPVVAPLPRGLRWRPPELDQLIGVSDEVYTAASLSIHIGDAGSAAETINAALRIPDGKTLKDSLPADVYQLYAGYSSRLGGSDQLEFLKPSFAAIELRKRAMQHTQLDTDGHVHDVIGFVARKHLVPLKALARQVTPNPRSAARALTRLSRDDDIQCARAQLELLRTELQDSAARARSWYFGNAAALQAGWERSQALGTYASCKTIFGALAPTQQAIRNTRDSSFRALSAALRRNHSTFATVLLDDVFDPQGVVNRLRDAGYKVEAP